MAEIIDLRVIPCAICKQRVRLEMFADHVKACIKSDHPTMQRLNAFVEELIEYQRRIDE